MKKTKVIAVFGYNNSRIYDLQKIRDLAKKRHGAEILLIKENITDGDRDAAHYCLDHRPEDHRVENSLRKLLASENLTLIGCLPFSDKGVIGAAHAAKAFGLFGDDSETSFAMLNKHQFRTLESKIQIDSNDYKKPFFLLAHSAEELEKALCSEGSYFLKPTSEGNSRGCMKIQSMADLQKWLKKNPGALNSGVICEEILSDANEYSFDGVDGAYWITQKFTTPGSFRAEYQHIIPAPLAEERQNAVHRILRPLLTSLGSNGGAFHHEFFLLGDERVASVEPNRRPAGMWIWDLAAWAFEDFDPWSRWIDRCAGSAAQEKELNQTAFSGIRGVISRKNGSVQKLDHEKIETQLAERFGKENLRISFLKKTREEVQSEPRDNSEFLAFIALKNKSYKKLLENLNSANEIFLENVEIAPCD